MSYDNALWARLLERLNGWCMALEVAPGRIQLTIDDPNVEVRSPQIVMTPEDWGEFVGTIWAGDASGVARQIKEQVLALREPHRFLVYTTYELVQSPEDTVPLDPRVEKLEALYADPNYPRGRWTI